MASEPAKHPFGRGTSATLPQQITTKGLVSEKTWILGNVVRVRQKKPAEGGENVPKGLSSCKNDPKGSHRDNANKKGKGKDTPKKPSQIYEIHLNGGNTPADVLMVVAWDDEPRKKLEAVGKMGATIAIHKAFIKEHDANSLKWTTSRHAFYAVLGRDADVRPYNGPKDWQLYHPVTKLPSLQYVRDERLVCVAARVLSPGPRIDEVTPEGSSETVQKTSFYARVENNIVLVEAWRETAVYAQEVKEGGYYFFDSIKRKEKRQDTAVMSVLRYQANTKHTECEGDLLKMLQDSTPNGWEGATPISPMFSGGGGMTPEELQKLMATDSPWLSLSVVAGIIEGKYRRKLQGSIQIASVLLKIPDQITYVSCADCTKGVVPQKTCSCATDKTTIRWLGRLRLEDDGSEVSATPVSYTHLTLPTILLV